MKYTVCLLFIITSSCGPEAVKFKRQYIIENGTGVPVELQFFRHGEPNLRFGTVQLSDAEQLEGLALERSGGPWEQLSVEQLSEAPVSSFEADSIIAIYNNVKLSAFIYRSDPNGSIFTPASRNILRNDDYSSIGNDRFLFRINESDFENAEDCNGPCE